MYYVRLFVNTGYDLVNIPYDPHTLAAEAYYDVPAIDYNEYQFLSEITVKFNVGIPTVSQPDLVDSRYISDIDYVAISPSSNFNMDRLNPNFASFYSVVKIQQQSTDVLKLLLAKDYITSAGGFKALKFRNGIITRLSMQSNAPIYIDDIDSFEEDEMLGCVRPLIVQYSTVAGDGDAKTTLVESTVDLDGAIGYESITDGTITDLIAKMGNAGTTNYYMGGVSGVRLSNINGSQCYFVGNSVVVRGLTNARALGIEDGILSQFVLPGAMHPDDPQYEDIVISEEQGAAGAIATIYSNDKDNINTGFDFFPSDVDFSQVFRNIFFGEKCKVGMIGASGETAEFKPEDIIFTPQGTMMSQILIKKRIDPRPQGRPYFRFQHIFRDATVGTIYNNTQDFMLSVKGANWKKVPLRFTTVSGVAVASMNFKNAMGIKNLQWEAGAIAKSYARRNLANQFNLMQDDFYEAATAISGIPSASWETPHGAYDPKTRSYAAPSGYDIAQFATSLGVNAVQRVASSARSGMDWEMNKLNLSLQMNAASEDARYYNQIQSATIEAEKAKFGVTSQLTVPQVNFTDDVDIFRDVTKNGVVVYRYRPDPRELARLTKIIKMFGAKRNILFDGNGYDLVGRDDEQGNPGGVRNINGFYFTYIEMQGAEVYEAGEWIDYNLNKRSRLPKYEREGIAAQLSHGVRIWKNATPKNYEVGYTDYLNTGNVTP